MELEESRLQQRVDSTPKGTLVISFQDDRGTPVKGIEASVQVPSNIIGLDEIETKTSNSEGILTWELVAYHGYRWRTTNRDVFIQPVHESSDKTPNSGEFTISEGKTTRFETVVLSDFNIVAGFVPATFQEDDKLPRIRLMMRGGDGEGDKQVDISRRNQRKRNGEFFLRVPREVTGSAYVCAHWELPHNGVHCDFVAGAECCIQPGYNNIGVLDFQGETPLEIEVRYVDHNNEDVSVTDIFQDPASVDVELYLSFDGDSERNFLTYLHGKPGQLFTIYGLYEGDWFVLPPDIDDESANYELISDLTGVEFSYPGEMRIELTQKVKRNSDCVYVSFRTSTRISKPRVYLRREGSADYEIHDPSKGSKKLLTGVYNVLIVSRKGSDSYAQETVEIHENTQDVILNVKKGSSLSGLVKPGERVTATFTPWNTGTKIAIPYSTKADEFGKFQLDGLPPYADIFINRVAKRTGGPGSTVEVGNL